MTGANNSFSLYMLPFLGLFWFATATAGRTEPLSVGPKKSYDSIEEAYQNASPGDTILVYPRPGNKPYRQPALQVKKSNLTFRGVHPDGKRIPLDGSGYNYSGKGSTPRAIFQFNPGANRSRLEGFKLFGAKNNTHNGAGVRINQADQIQIRNCEIYGNDMGIMSNGDGSLETARNQQIVSCHIHDNGAEDEPGLNHNLYLGGTSVTLTACRIHSPLTGHNVKSRAHHTRVQFSYVHDSDNREFDLVDKPGQTNVPKSHAVLLGNIIEKRRDMDGNRSVIHFGQDGGEDHHGTLYLIHNTVITPYSSPIVELSAPGTGVKLTGNIFWNGGSKETNQTLITTRAGAGLDKVSGRHNWFSAGYRKSVQTLSERIGPLYLAGRGTRPPFRNPGQGNYRLTRRSDSIVDAGVEWSEISLPRVPGVSRDDMKLYSTFLQYEPPLSIKKRKPVGAPDLGAFEYRRE